MRNRRSLGLWLLILAFGGLGLSGWLRLAASYPTWYWMSTVGASSIPLYQILSGGMWGLLGGLAAIWLLVLGKAYRWVGLGIAGIIFITFWIDRLLVGRVNGLEPNLVFLALTSGLGLAFTAWILRPWAKPKGKGD